jgi:hypothetical protein
MKKRIKPVNQFLPYLFGLLMGVSLLAATGAQAASTTYTSDSQFDLGTLLNVNHNAPNNDQLQLNITGTGFPILWVANAGEHTLSKIDTTQIGASPGREMARYYTWFSNQAPSNYAWSGAAPSRTAVDIDGNAYVLNRHFDGRSAVLFKILANGFIDRNGNGVVDSSSDVNHDGVIQASEMMPLIDSNSNGIIDPGEIQDERIAWAIRTPDGVGAPLRTSRLGRSLCIGTDGNLWVGLHYDNAYYKVSAADGHTITGPVPVPSVSPYGCLVDKDGTLWSAGLGSYLGKIANTQSNTGPYPASSFYHGNFGSNYGIALGQDPVDGHTLVYLGGTGYSYLKFDAASNAFSTPAATYVSSLGVNTDGDGNILVSKSNGGAIKFAPNGTVIWNKPAQTGTSGDSRGIMPDANSDIWQVHLAQSKTSKFLGTDGTALGVVPTGNSPYTYSDASGFAAANITVSTGTWKVIQDGGAAGTLWGKVSWNASVPTGASVTTMVRTADTEAGLQAQSFTNVSNGVNFTQNGRFIEAQVRFTANNQGDSPVVYDVTVASTSQLKCDVDRDGDIDQLDLALISRARGQRATGPDDPRNADSDQLITPNDVKVCIQRCTRPNCAIQ